MRFTQIFNRNLIRPLLILAALALIAAGCTKKDEERPTPKTENFPKGPPSYDFVDKGFKNAEVSLEKGKVTVTYSYDDQGDFVLWLTSTDNSDSHLIANIKGPKTALVVVDIPKAANYMVKIQTEGSYTVSLRETKTGQ
jgi:hypothetical protein